MARFPVHPHTEEQLADRMTKLGIFEDDLEEKFVKGRGPGGQKINKTSSCVYLCHLPTGIEVKCQTGRSQSMNRFYARRELCEKLEQKLFGEKSRREQEHEKIRRQKRRRSRRQKEKMLESKHARSETKQTRRRVDSADY